MSDFNLLTSETFRFKNLENKTLEVKTVGFDPLDFNPSVYTGPKYQNAELACSYYWTLKFSYWNSLKWSQTLGVPDFERYKKFVGNPVKSWALYDTIWTPTLQDSFPADPLLLHSFRVMDDESVLKDIFTLIPEMDISMNQ